MSAVPCFQVNLPLFLSIFILLTSALPSHQYQEEMDSYEAGGGYLGGLDHSSGGISKIDAKLNEMSRPKELPKNLSCHVCYTDSHHDCATFPQHFLTSDGSLVAEGEGEDGLDNRVNWNNRRNKGKGKPKVLGYPTQCLNESYVCSVRKFAFSLSNGTGHAPMKTFALKRNCTLASSCVPGCVVMGERTRIYVCSTCCTTNLCNTGNGAEASFRRNFLRTLFLGASALLPLLLHTQLLER